MSKPVEGVNAGKIENIELVSRAIREAMSEAEEQLGIRITEAMGLDLNRVLELAEPHSHEKLIQATLN